MKRFALNFAFFIAFAMAAIGSASAYTAKITNATLGAPGVCLDIEICWVRGMEAAPTSAGMSAVGQEVDSPPLDPNDPLGSSSSPSPVTGVYTDPDNPSRDCQKWTFCFPNVDCEHGDEEFSATVTIHGTAVGTGVYRERLPNGTFGGASLVRDAPPTYPMKPFATIILVLSLAVPAGRRCRHLDFLTEKTRDNSSFQSPCVHSWRHAHNRDASGWDS